MTRGTGGQSYFRQRSCHTLETRAKSKISAEIVAAWVALNGVKNERKLVGDQANAGDNDFFIALGRHLSGKRKRLWDEVDEAIARNWKRILVRMGRKDGARWMQENGFPFLTYDGYRQRLVGLKLTRWDRKNCE